MPVTTQMLRNIMTEARPIIERQLNDAKLIAGLRDIVASNGGDWSALKALIKAHVEDEADGDGEGKRVRKILDKADSSSAYADMLGLANMNENNFSSGRSYADARLVETVAAGVQTETGRKALVAALDVMIEAEETIDPETGEIIETQESQTKASEDNGATGTAIEVPSDNVAGEASRASVGAGSDDVDAATTRAGTASTPNRSMRISPLEPRKAGGLRGFGFTVSFDDPPAAIVEQPEAPNSSPATSGVNFDPSKLTFLRKCAADYRPHCQRPDCCASSGLHHCHTCQKIADALESEVA